MDITDFYSSVSRTRVSPQKSYVASYSNTTSYADTGATLSVANGQFYAAVFSYVDAGSGNFSYKLLEGATTKQTATQTISAGTFTYFTLIFQNTSGSTQTVKLQTQYTSAASGNVTNIQLISGSFVQLIPPNGSINIPISAYITNLEMVNATLGTESAVMSLTQDVSTTTSSSITGLNLFVNGINCSTTGSTTLPSYVAFDFDGKTVSI